MNDVGSAVGGQAGLLDSIVKAADVPDFFKGKLWMTFVGRRQHNRSHTDYAVQKASAKLDIDNPEHIKIIDLAVKNTSAEFDSIRCNFVIRHPDLQGLIKKE